MADASTLSNVTCSFIYSDTVLIEKDEVDKVVCLTDGRVLELFNENVVGSCITPYLNASEVSVFYSYDPFIKYYLIRQDTTLVIIQKLNGSLQIFKSYENVQNYEIDDFLIIGRPQVKIWLLNEMEPLLTDFSNRNLCKLNDLKEIQRVSDLNRKLHMMRSASVHINKISIDRKLMKENYFKNYCSTSSLVLVKDPWQRIVDGRWIICVCIKNDYKFPVDNLQLIINNGCYNYIETKVCNFFHADVTKRFSGRDLSSNSYAYIVGITSEPNFNDLKDSIITLSCSLLYNVSKNVNVQKLNIPKFVLNIENLINKNLGIFQSVTDNLLPDIVTCIAIYKVLSLKINLKNINNDTLVHSILINKLNFINFQIIENENMLCYVTNPHCNSMLTNMVIFVENVSINMYSIVCYAKDDNQVALLKHYLQILLQNDLIDICMKKRDDLHGADGSIISAVNKLDKEFDHFTSVMRTGVPIMSSLPIKEEDNLSFTVETWKQLIESTLQFETDVEFQSALKDDKM